MFTLNVDGYEAHLYVHIILGRARRNLYICGSEKLKWEREHT